MNKFLQFTMGDGSVWEMQAEEIAKRRADYYATRDHEQEGLDYQKVYEEEYAYTLSDSYELTDWACNNMDWSEIKELSVVVQPPRDIDYEAEWAFAQREIVTH
jgi:hypothetical protein